MGRGLSLDELQRQSHFPSYIPLAPPVSSFFQSRTCHFVLDSVKVDLKPIHVYCETFSFMAEEAPRSCRPP